MIKLVIFDMDGVLVDACEWHRIALNESLKEVCNYEITLEQHYNEFNGLPTKVKLRKLSERGILSEDKIDIVENIKQDKTLDVIAKECRVRDEKIELMKRLKKNNLKIACYTNSIRKTAELMLEKTGIKGYFDLILTNQDVTQAKPNPEGYIKLMNIFNVANSECIIVEDSPNGLKAAKSSGATVLEVKNQDYVTCELFKGLL
jgi:HAD superfamily hydrolase (TIGR01509 family)